MDALIQQWGYLAVYIGTVIEGEVVYLSGILASQLGHLSLAGVVFLSFLGAISRDSLIFLISRKGGHSYMSSRPAISTKVSGAGEWVEKRSLFFLIFYRFFYGVSTVVVLALAVSGISYFRYGVICLTGSCLWAIVYGTVGYVAAPGAVSLFQELGGFAWVILLAILVGVILYMAFYKRKS